MNFLNIIEDSADNESQLTTDEQFDIDFALMTGELSQLLADFLSLRRGQRLTRPANNGDEYILFAPLFAHHFQ